MTIFFISIFCTYYLLTCLLIVGFLRVTKKRAFQSLELPCLKISVIVPFKNEESNLAALIQSIAAQNYPKKKFEVILVDDHSSDDSVRVVLQTIRELDNFTMMSTGWADSGKKRALTRGIAKAKGQIIVTTDADCIVQPEWLACINKAFHRDQAQLVFGGVAIADDLTFFSRLQAMEFASLIASGAATLSLGAPTMCNAANLAFPKDVFKEVNGYEGNFEIASGDDEFLLRKIQAKYPKGIFFMNDPEGIVSTKPQQTLRGFIHQRMRWAAKLPHNPSLLPKVLAWYVLLFQTSYFLLMVLFFAHIMPLKVSLLLLACKWVLELIFLVRATVCLKVKWNTVSFLTWQLSYPFYILLVAIFSRFIPYKWKGSTYRA
jgi:biofilm PGA synthesis N-glycosyltransferase PgaC